MQRHILLFALIITAAAVAEAANPAIRPGQYVLDRDSGTLIIRKGERNEMTFEIESIGGNCHSCSISGVISGAIGHGDSWAADGGDSKCEISFSTDGTAMVVRPITEKACRTYCGMRAGFEGTYRVPPTNCTNEGRQKLRDRFLRLYGARRFIKAGEALQSMVAECSDFMSWIEIDRVRNDIALAQYHSGEFQQCLATLSNTLAGTVKDEEEFKSGEGNVYLPPCDFDNYIVVAKATWFNRALCTKAKTKGR